MPLFRKQSGSAKKKLQHQQYLAKESPEKTYDISNCELSEIPQGIYSLCKVMQKEALIAHTNWLTSLKGGGEITDLQTLRVLDLSHNELTQLPDEIAHLTCLQVLNIEDNKVKSLPQSIGSLQALQTLNCKGNKLKHIPAEVETMRSLRTLDLSDNHVTRLPVQLCKARTLEQLIVDCNEMAYPPADICHQGTEAMMRFLCSESGIDYHPPSEYLLDVLDSPNVMTSATQNALQADINHIQDQYEDTITQYQVAKATRQHEMLMLERQLEEENKLQAKMAAEAARNKKHLVDYMAQDQERVLGELSIVQRLKEKERKQLVKTLYEAEQSAADLVAQLLEMNEKAKNTEELLEKMERERMKSEEWFKVRQEEVENLRKQEVLVAMKRVLAENDAMNKVLNNYFANQDEVKRKAQVVSNVTEGLVENVLNEKHIEQQSLIDHLLKEEKLQKEAFEMLTLQKDSKHLRITGQIDLIHQELTQMTIIELQQRDAREELQKDILEKKRLALTELLIQLMHERDIRESELRKRMHEMEEQRDANQTDYWLVQYQRLMDRKPHALIDQERKLEFAVLEILEAAQAEDYIPVFARHRITIETLCYLSEDDLKQMGMHELGLRKAVLREVEKYMLRMEEERAAAKLKQIDLPEEKDWAAKKPAAADVDPHPHATPSAPKKSPVTPSSPPLEVIARGFNSECVICLDALSSVLFLYCGHVCSCPKCAQPLEECPMCRGAIVQRVQLV